MGSWRGWSRVDDAMSADESRQDRAVRTSRSAYAGSRNGVVSAERAARRALRQVEELTGRDPDGVVSVERQDHGWRVGVEVVEVHRIPDTTDVLAIYEADLDENGRLRSCRRTKRYSRGQTRND